MQLLSCFKQTSELEFSIFERDALLEHANVFNSDSDGLGKPPEAFSFDLDKEKTPIVAVISSIYKKSTKPTNY